MRIKSLFEELKVIREALIIESKVLWYWVLWRQSIVLLCTNYKIILLFMLLLHRLKKFFLKLKLLKSYLWSSMSQDSLNSLILISIWN